MRPIKSGAALRLKDRLRPVFPAAPAHYVFRDQIQFIIMFMMFVLSCMLGLILVMLNLVQNLILQLSIFPAIQKYDYGQSVDLTMVGFAQSPRPEKFTSVNFKIWKSKVHLLFTAMHI